MLELPPLSLYIHIPWCVRKCPYCDFNSHRMPERLPEQEYIKALTNDLRQELDHVQGRKIQSIFIGGGTPSLFSAESIERILNQVREYIDFKEGIEITLEANPGTAEQQKFADYKAAGVNRLSIGIQSFNNDSLGSLGRIHNGEQSHHAIDMALQAGFKQINIDLMHGLPNQSQEGALADIEVAINSGVTHLSWYQLTLEPNTEFYSKPPPLPTEAELIEIQQSGQLRLQEAGFKQYEVSAFVLNDDYCQHNMNYWQFGDYLGIGAGAHGKISLPEQEKIIRTKKIRHPQHYLDTANNPSTKIEPVARDELSLEFMMNALRLKSGVPADFFTERTGLNTKIISKKILKLQDQGLLQTVNSRYCTSELGYRFLNSVLQNFY